LVFLISKIRAFFLDDNDQIYIKSIKDKADEDDSDSKGTQIQEGRGGSPISRHAP
jgi:hypothetical protein